MRSWFVLATLVGIQTAVAISLFSFGYLRARKTADRWTKRLPVLDERSALLCIRRLRYFPASCLMWSLVASGYLNACTVENKIAFSARLSGGRMVAHAFLKFPDGYSIGERVELIELS